MEGKKRPNRDYSFVGNNHKNRHVVKAVNLDIDEETYYHSMYACSKYLGVNCGIIKMCAEGKNYVKSGISKKDGKKYKFEYVDNLPEGVIVLKCERKKKDSQT